MAQRRPITTHPAFAPLVASWFAALLGLGTAVLPPAMLARALDAPGLSSLALSPLGARIAISALAALMGALIGLAIARVLARRGRDPRPVYAEPDEAALPPEPPEPARRPLRVREELEGVDLREPEGAAEDGGAGTEAAAAPRLPAGMADAVMILSPQPVHPPDRGPDLEALLAQFDSAITAARQSAAPGPEPAPGQAPAQAPGQAPEREDSVRAFVARQTGRPAPSPLGGAMPDHQAELRAALDKLAGGDRDR
jgi:hypothetical protein